MMCALNLFALANTNNSLQAENCLKNSTTFKFSRNSLLNEIRVTKLLTASRYSLNLLVFLLSRYFQNYVHKHLPLGETVCQQEELQCY